MIDVENYISGGDQIIAVPRSTNRQSIYGRVLQVIGTELGRREYVVEVEGRNCVVDGAVGVPEKHFLFEVERRDAWVLVPPYLLQEDAEEKAERSLINTRKRIYKKAPLFADQVEVEEPDIKSMMTRAAEDRRESLEREHLKARRSTELRAQVASLINHDQFAVLQAARSRFPRSASYGTYFWEKQLCQIRETGKPDIYVPPPAVPQGTQIDWLRFDRAVVWRSPTGPRRVRILYVGSSDVLIKLLAEPITDYDPKEFPYGNCWVDPKSLRYLAVSDAAPHCCSSVENLPASNTLHTKSVKLDAD